MKIQTLCHALEKAEIPYALVGGYAVALHGAVRGTTDIDLVIRQEKQYFIKIENAMHSLGLKSRLPVTAEEVFEFRKEYIQNRNMIAWSFYNPQRPSELIDIIITLDLSSAKKIKKSYNGQPIYVLGIEDLIKMKKESGRPQDLADVNSLEMLK